MGILYEIIKKRKELKKKGVIPKLSIEQLVKNHDIYCTRYEKCEECKTGIKTKNHKCECRKD